MNSQNLLLRVAVLTFALFLPFSLFAQTLLERGILEYRAERFEEALEIFEEVYRTSPSTLVSFYLGLTYKQVGDLRKAKEYFVESLTRHPKIFDSYVELIDVLNALDEIDEAKRWISEAEREGILPAKIAYLKGLVLLKENKNTEAISAFRKAKELDPQLAQVCDIQIAFALTRERKIKDAMAVLKNLVQTDPTSEIAELSKDYLATLEVLREIYKEWRFNIDLGYIYDDNVVAKPEEKIGVIEIDRPTHKKDTAFTGNLRIQYNPNLKGNLILLTSLNVYAKRFQDVRAYDQENLSFNFTPGYGFKRGAFTLPLEYYYMTLNDRSYMRIRSLRPMLNYRLSDSSVAQFSIGYAKRDMLRKIVGADPDEDRDAIIWNMAPGFFLNFGRGKGLFSSRYEFTNDETEGKNWVSYTHRIYLGLIYKLVDKLSLNLTADQSLQKFKNVSTLSGKGIPGFPERPKRREDRPLNLSAAISYEPKKFLRINASYTHSRSNSNFPIYDYRRNLLSFELSFNF